MRNLDSSIGSELVPLRSHIMGAQAGIATHAGTSASLLHRNACSPQPANERERRLFVAAVTDRRVSACESAQASRPVTMLAMSFAKSASHITDGKDGRFEALLLED